jgi:hypothetical protein
VVVATGVVFGLLVMHGLDVRFVNEGHGLASPPAALAAALDQAARAGATGPATAWSAAGASWDRTVGHCMAVLVAAALALMAVALAALRRLAGSRAAAVPGRGPDPPPGFSESGRAPPPARIALCVSLC